MLKTFILRVLLSLQQVSYTNNKEISIADDEIFLRTKKYNKNNLAQRYD